MDADFALAKIDLAGCPVGTVLDVLEADREIENRYFAGWTCALTPRKWPMPSSLRVILDQGIEVMEHVDRTDRCLTAGDPMWGDYQAEMHVRHMAAFSRTSADEPHNLTGRTGMLLRYQDLRRYYFFGLIALDRIGLYRREDEAWTSLDEWNCGLDRAHYYHLKAVCAGPHLTCFVDGKQVFLVTDDRFLTGKFGIRMNTRSRIHSVRVMADTNARAAFAGRLSRDEKEVADAADAYPKPVLWGRVDLSDFWPCEVRFGDFRGAGKKEIIVQRETGNGVQVACLTPGGKVVFDQIYSRASGLKRMVAHDLNADGFEDLIGIRKDRLVVVSGRSGDVIAETQLPRTGPYRGFRGASVGDFLNPLPVLWPCKLRHTEKPQDLILRDGDDAGSAFSIWAFDEHLNLRWRQDAHDTWYGMYMWFYDVDGDGRDEILPGYQLYDGDGRLLWVMEGAEYIEDAGGPGHVDHAAFGELDGDPANGPEIGIAGSDPGFFLVDARTGAVRRHHPFGHVQGIYAGNFRPDLPGLEMWMGDRWGTYGIQNLVSGTGEPLSRFEPDNITDGGQAINWKGDGEELLFLYRSAQAFGFYDAACRRLIRPVCEGLPFDWCERLLVEDIVGDARDEVSYVFDGALYIVTQDRPYPSGQKIYKPVRRPDISHPGWEINP